VYAKVHSYVIKQLHRGMLCCVDAFRQGGPASAVEPIPSLQKHRLNRQATRTLSLRRCPLPAVVLNGIPEVGDALMATLACCPQLQRLSLCNCSELTDAGLASIAAALPSLRELRLDDCTKVGIGIRRNFVALGKRP
jgi:hypothetical protein